MNVCGGRSTGEALEGEREGDGALVGTELRTQLRRAARVGGRYFVQAAQLRPQVDGLMCGVNREGSARERGRAREAHHEGLLHAAPPVDSSLRRALATASTGQASRRVPAHDEAQY